MAFAPYGGTFEQMMNEFCSPQNIAATAARFKELEKQYAPYTFGKFVKHFLKNPGEFANWDKDAGGIPDAIRQRLAHATDGGKARRQRGRPVHRRLKTSPGRHIRPFVRPKAND